MEPPAEVVAHDAGWAASFEVLRARLLAVLGPDAVVEHVGSTAVPGLSAKPVLDVDVVVAGPEEVPATVAALVAAGWDSRGDLGIPGREAFSVLPGLPYHHLYVVVAGSPPHRDHVDLRDHLRRSAAARADYEAEKRRLAPLLLTDREAYVDGKAPVVARLLAQARSATSSRTGRSGSTSR